MGELLRAQPAVKVLNYMKHETIPVFTSQARSASL